MEAFCEEWCLRHITDSSNETDDFLRNRLRHHVMPLLKAENPRFSENTSAMALRLRLDEEYLAQSAADCPEVETLKALHPALRNRVLENFLKTGGVREPEAVHIARVEALLYSDKPSAKADLPGGICIARNYGRLEARQEMAALEQICLTCPGTAEVGEYVITCRMAEEIIQTEHTFTVLPQGELILRARESGDSIRLSGGTKSLKKLFIDRKIPASRRDGIPVIADGAGVLGVYSIGPNQDRVAKQLPAVQIQIKKI